MVSEIRDRIHDKCFDNEEYDHDENEWCDKQHDHDENEWCDKKHDENEWNSELYYDEFNCDRTSFLYIAEDPVEQYGGSYTYNLSEWDDDKPNWDSSPSLCMEKDPVEQYGGSCTYNLSVNISNSNSDAMDSKNSGYILAAACCAVMLLTLLTLLSLAVTMPLVIGMCGAIVMLMLVNGRNEAVSTELSDVQQPVNIEIESVSNSMYAIAR